MSKRPVAIDLFAGCGGMSLGLEAAGFDVAVAVEFDAVHCMVHHVNFPYCATICKDAAKVSSAEIRQALRKGGYGTEIDLIAGGPPCQGFSHMGKRQLDDPRNSLVFEYLRIISELKPKYFIFENVPGIASGEHRGFLDELMSEFETIGYRIESPFRILDASEYGAPQKRRRVILIGSRKDVAQATYPEPTHSAASKSSGDLFSKQLKPLVTVKEAISDLSTIKAHTGSDEGVSYKRLDYQGYRSQYATKPKGMFKLCHKRTVGDLVWGHLGSVHTEESIARFSDTVPGDIEPKSRFLRLNGNGQCNTLRAGTNSDKGAYTAPRPIHYSAARCITIREAARLHTFPDWFQFHRTVWHGFREIGNAVIPALSKALGDSVIEALRIDARQLETKMLPPVDEELLTYTMSEASAYWGIDDDVIPKRKRLI